MYLSYSQYLIFAMTGLYNMECYIEPCCNEAQLCQQEIYTYLIKI